MLRISFSGYLVSYFSFLSHMGFSYLPSQWLHLNAILCLWFLLFFFSMFFFFFVVQGMLLVCSSSWPQCMYLITASFCFLIVNLYFPLSVLLNAHKIIFLCQFEQNLWEIWFCRVTFWRIVSNKSTEKFSGVPYPMTLLNCLLSAW